MRGEPHVASDPRHSAAEYRFIAVGRNAQGSALFVAFTVRTRDRERLIRPLSARYMHRKKVASYEAQGA